ncbi:hypothetical protein IWX50DRAFT_487216 [Phyllosticta citricarpa]|uniref:Uncharacterized protein n=1 Tax=Phyllosticta citricarpa TaxID=55181 RepID=A0ABR1MPP1_9PEZI
MFIADHPTHPLIPGTTALLARRELIKKKKKKKAPTTRHNARQEITAGRRSIVHWLSSVPLALSLSLSLSLSLFACPAPQSTVRYLCPRIHAIRFVASFPSVSMPQHSLPQPPHRRNARQARKKAQFSPLSQPRLSPSSTTRPASPRLPSRTQNSKHSSIQHAIPYAIQRQAPHRCSHAVLVWPCHPAAGKKIAQATLSSTTTRTSKQK